MNRHTPVMGIAGGKNAGKTTLVTKLVAELVARGLTVSTIKHAHHTVDVDQEGRDSHRHREAGAQEVVLSTPKRWAVMHELRGKPEPELDDLLRHLSPADIIIIEGFKRSDFPKIEVRREGAKATPLGAEVPGIVAIASDHDVPAASVPILDLPDIAGIADFVLKFHGLSGRRGTGDDAGTSMPVLDPGTLDDCFAHDKDRLTHDEALALITQRARAMTQTEAVSITQACGRYVAEAVVAPRPIPAHDNAAVDGYAVAHDDLAAGAPFDLADRIPAGDSRNVEITPGSAARIFTGAAMPLGADTVVMQEDALTGETGAVTLPSGIKSGANVRSAGEDLMQGDRIVSPGQRLRPQDVAALASAGVDRVSAFRRLRVGILSSGNEITPPGQPLVASGVYDANGPLLTGLLSALPVEAVPLGIVPDERDAVLERLDAAARQCDVVITTGGASRGEEDHFVKTVAEEGRLHAWQIAIKPGRPLGLGTYRDTAVMILPGNPVAVMVCFLLYGFPLLTGLGGGTVQPPPRYPVRAAFGIARKKPDRREFLRGRLLLRDGALWAEKYPRDGSGLISSLTASDGLLDIPESATQIEEGSVVDFIPFSAFGITR